MYLNRWVMLISFLVGVPGLWFTQDAFSEYRNAVRSFTQVEIRYVPGSYRWLDPEFGSSELQLTLANQSPDRVTIDALELRLYFDGEFAGARYSRWEPVRTEAGTNTTLTETIVVSMSGIRHLGGEAELEIRGRAVLSFDRFEQSVTIRVQEVIGTVSHNER